MADGSGSYHKFLLAIRYYSGYYAR